MHGHLVLRRGRPPISVRLGVGSLVVLAAAAVGVVALLAVGVGSGDFPLSPGEVLVALFGGGDETSRFVVWTLRLPRLLGAVLVGASLAISGAIFQALARNPLVAPDIIGINGGAALAAVAIIVLGAPSALIGPAAFVGAFAAALLVYLLAWRGGIGPYRLVLVGIGIAAAATAGVSLLITRSEILAVKEATVWLIGSLYATGWEDVALVAASLAILIPASVVLGRRLALLQLGDEAAVSMGMHPERARLALLGVAVTLAAVSVAVAGPIGFVAFVAPHLARRLARASGSGILPAAAAIGALLLIGSDILARRILEPSELPVGILTVILGAPYFLWLLSRSQRAVGST